MEFLSFPLWTKVLEDAYNNGVTSSARLRWKKITSFTTSFRYTRLLEREGFLKLVKVGGRNGVGGEKFYTLTEKGERVAELVTKLRQEINGTKLSKTGLWRDTK